MNCRIKLYIFYIYIHHMSSTVASDYITLMKTTLLFKFWLLTSFFRFTSFQVWLPCFCVSILFNSLIKWKLNSWVVFIVLINEWWNMMNICIINVSFILQFRYCTFKYLSKVSQRSLALIVKKDRLLSRSDRRGGLIVNEDWSLTRADR